MPCLNTEKEYHDIVGKILIKFDKDFKNKIAMSLY
jgi:hypothetical protein